MSAWRRVGKRATPEYVGKVRAAGLKGALVRRASRAARTDAPQARAA